MVQLYRYPYSPSSVSQHMSYKYTVGVIGAGNVSQNFHLPIIKKNENIEISYIADINRQNAKKAASYYDTNFYSKDLPESLPKTDIAIVAIPVSIRDEYLEFFRANNTHVMCEKPFATSITEFENRTRGDNIVFCNYMREHFKNIQYIKSILESSKFGSLRSVEVSETKIMTSTGKSQTAVDPEKRGGGILPEKGSHTLSQIAALFDGKGLELQSSDVIWNDKLDIDVNMRINTQGREIEAPIDVHLSWICDSGTYIRLEFERGIITCDHTDPADPVKIEGIGELDTTAKGASTSEAAMYLRWKKFLNSISEEKRLAKNKTRQDSGARRSVARLIGEVYDNEQPE